MTATDVTMVKTKTCAVCNRRMHHGYKGISISNYRGKVKAYVCSDTCSKAQMGLMEYAVK